MYELSRVRLYSVGPAGARYEDVTIDLSRAGKPVQRAQPTLLDGPEVLRPSPATVLFLENGGGKSVLIKLVFSVMLPGKRQIVGTSNTRVLEKFVERGDVAHVVLEWMHTETGRLLVTGKVSEWRPRRNSADDGLAEIWYSFRPGPSAGLASLPFSEAGQNLVAGAFRDRLAELADDDPSLELFWADRHHKWEERLTSLGLDPELFEFQRRMNAGEGEAADAFTFGTDEALVEFLLKAVLSDADAVSLSDSLEEYAKTLANRDALELEHDFVAATLEQLEPLAVQHAAAEAAQQLLAAREAELNGFAASVAARIGQERAQTAAQASRVHEAQAAIEKARKEAANAASVQAELARRAARFRVEQAEAKFHMANEALDDAAGLVLAWAATGPLADWATKAQNAAQLRAVLQEEQDVRAAALRVRDTRAGDLVRALLRAVAKAEHEAIAQDKQVKGLTEAAAKAQQDHDKVVTTRADARAKAGNLEASVAEVTTEVDLAVRDGLVSDADSVPAAAEALAETARTADAAVSAQNKQITDLDNGVESAQTALIEARQKETAAQAERDKAAEAVTKAKAAMAALAGDERLRELVEGTEVVLETDAEVLVERLTEGLAAVDRKRIELRVADAADDRARLALESGNDALYPPPPEIEELVELLKAERINCYSGWNVLADIPDEETRSELVTQLPHLAGGVLLNNPDDLDRARQFAQAGGYEPTCLITVATTQSFDLEPKDGFELLPHGNAGFVIPPHKALYDHEAARAEGTRINQRHAERAERIAELNQRHAADLGLRTRLSQWREEYPPGRYAELSGWQTATQETLATKETAVRACLAAIDEAKRLQKAARGKLTELIDAARIARERAAKVARLRERVAKAAVWQQEAQEAHKAERAANVRIEELRIRREDLQKQASEQRRLGDLQRAIVERLREEITKAGGEEKANCADAEPGRPVPVLRKLLEDAETAYIQAQVGSDLVAEAARAEKAAMQAKTVLDNHSEAAREHAVALLASPEAADAAGRAAATALARARETEARKIRDDAMRSHSQCQTRYSDLPTPSAPVDLPEEPQDIDHAQQLLADAGIALKTAQITVENREETHAVLTAALGRIEDTIKGFERVTDALDSSEDSELGSAPGHGAPYLGTPDDALARLKELRKAVKEARNRRGEARDLARRIADTLCTTMSEARFHTLASPVRTQITAVPAGELGGHAAAWAVALRPRLRSLSDDLAQSKRHRTMIIARLQGMVENALRTLRQAQRLSRLPAGLGDWSGEEFLRFTYKPVEGEVLTQQLSEVIDTAARESGRRDGMTILLRGVRAAAPRGFKVTMLKPDAVLRTERVRVSEVRDVFSGGQHLTAAIMLYCTLAALRANSKGHSGQRHSGVLFLDNPIGRASAGYLLDLQRAVAAALGVQLVYTTGLFDAEALGAFPLIVRLRNDADLRAGRKYLSVDQSIGATLGALPDPDGTARLAASRVLLKERHRDEN